MERNVTLYTQPDCPPCTIVKQFFEHYGVNYQEVDISKDQDSRLRMEQELNSLSTPTVTIGDHVIRGFDIASLSKLLGIE